MFKLVAKDEEWRPVIMPDFDYTGFYEVSSCNRLKSVSHYTGSKNGSKRLTPEVIMKIPVTKTGYCRVELFDGTGKSKKYFFHQIVAFAFPEICGKYFEGAVVNHKDENTLNNFPFNLEWCSQKYNVNYGTGIKRRVESSEKSGKHRKPVKATSKKDSEQVLYFKSIMEAAESGFDYRAILRCLKNEYGYKYHKGYKWEYN